MSPEPAGSVIRKADGLDLILTRELPLSLEEAWSWASDSDQLEKWFGTWAGSSGTGERIEVTMNAEAEPHTSEWEILDCQPGSSYEIKSVGGIGWHLKLKVESTGSGSRLTFIQHLENEEGIGSIGAGWEWYLDRLVAAIENNPMPDFEDYWPSMGPYYEANQT